MVWCEMYATFLFKFLRHSTDKHRSKIRRSQRGRERSSHSKRRLYLGERPFKVSIVFEFKVFDMGKSCLHIWSCVCANHKNICSCVSRLPNRSWRGVSSTRKSRICFRSWCWYTEAQKICALSLSYHANISRYKINVEAFLVEMIENTSQILEY